MDRHDEKLIAQARSDSDVLAVILFGSRARGEGGPSSDRDICLVLAAGAHTSSQSSEKRLAYLANFDLDIHVFQDLPLYIRQRVLREGRVIFCRDEKDLYALAFRSAQAFEDFKHLYHEYLEAVARG